MASEQGSEMSRSQPAGAQQQPPQFTYVDLPEVSETFSDHVRMISFDGQTLRIEFCVSRVDPARPPAPATGRRYPCCRLVLSAAATLELMNQMQRITQSLVQAGVLKAEQQGTPQAPAQN
jgi:hypothetical protein